MDECIHYWVYYGQFDEKGTGMLKFYCSKCLALRVVKEHLILNK